MLDHEEDHRRISRHLVFGMCVSCVEQYTGPFLRPLDRPLEYLLVRVQPHQTPAVAMKFGFNLNSLPNYRDRCQGLSTLLE